MLFRSEEGLPEEMAALKEFNEISDKLAEPMDADEMEKLIDKQAKAQEKIDALDAWDIDSRLELAMDALGCPPPNTPVKNISGGERRRVATPAL